MARVRVPVLWVVVLLAAACSGAEEDEVGPKASLTPVSRPIVDIVPAASIDEEGQPVDPTLVFAPDAPRITIVARAGEVTGSPMDITWSQVTDEGEQELFTHTVEVGSFDAAYSVGENPGTLTPGTYRVEATLEGESLSTQFEVEASGEAEAAGQGATSGPPSSGDSGAVGPPIAPGQVDETALFTFLNHEPVDPNAARIQLMIMAGLEGGSGRVEAKAGMGGGFRTLSFPTDELGLVNKILDFDPCAHPGGSDLPGTGASFEITLFGDGGAGLEAIVYLIRLGPDTARPAVTLNIEPRSGSQVEPGDEIFFDATAEEARSGLSWQTGVRDLRVKAIPGEDLVPQVRADSSTAQPCDRKQWSLVTQGSYEVPDDPPPTFRICPIANDFAGNQNSDTCATYFTGDELWEGTYAGTVTWDCGPLGQRTGTLAGDFTITVDADGKATMVDDNTVTGSCSLEGSLTTRITTIGERTASGFDFPSFLTTSGSLFIEVSGDRGSGHLRVLTPDNALVDVTLGMQRV